MGNFAGLRRLAKETGQEKGGNRSASGSVGLSFKTPKEAIEGSVQLILLFFMVEV